MGVELRELDVVGEEEDLGLRWIEAGNDDGGVRMEAWDGVEEMGLVLWWVGDKEMMVLGGICGLVARRGG